MKYIVILLVFGTLYSVPYAAITLAYMIGFFSIIYYYLCFTLMVGLRTSKIESTDKDTIKGVTLSVGANLTGVCALVMQTPYVIVGYVAAPMIAITTATAFICWLIAYDFIDIKRKED